MALIENGLVGMGHVANPDVLHEQPENRAEGHAGKAPYSNLTGTLEIIARETHAGALWACEVIALIAIIGMLFAIYHAQVWQHLIGLSIGLAFVTTSACGGAYMIAVKSGIIKRR